MSLINGTGTSTFLRIEGAGSSPDVSSYTFPLCNENGGLKETWDWKGITHDLLSYKLVKKKHGYRVTWDFTFDDWADGATLIKFKGLKNSLDNGTRWNLRPRDDDQFAWRIFEVQCTSDNFEVVLDNTGEWHTGFHIQFQTTDLVSSIDWQLVNTDTVEYAVLLENIATP